MRWSLLLQEFQYSVEHIPGRENQLPDALSRNPGSDLTTEDLQETERLLPYDYTPPQAPSGQQACLLTEEEPLLHVIQDAQREDPHIQRLVEMAAYIPGPGETQPWIFEEGLLKHRVGERRTIVVPPAARPQVIQRHHDHYTAGHPGIEETIRAIKQRYFWPGMQPEITDHVRCCRICNAYKRGAHQTPAPLRPHAPAGPFEVISVAPDASPAETPCTRWTIRGHISRRRWTNDSHPQRKSIRNCRPRFVFPMDRGQGSKEGHRHRHRRVSGRDLPAFWIPKGHPQRQWTAVHVRQWTAVHVDRLGSSSLRKWQSLHWTTPIYHPRANPVERRNQELKKGLRIQLEGQTPDRWERIHANELRYRERRYAQPNAQMPIQPQVGDQVLVKAHPLPGQHFSPKWMGPYPVVELAGPTAVWVERPGAHRAKYHLDQVRRARRPRPPQPQQPLPADAVPQQPLPADAVPQQPLPADAVPQQPLPADAVPQQPLSDDVEPQHPLPDTAAPQVADSRPAAHN
ncbi:Integrase zinc binding domain [Popillia japonica]|uniref:RNA-directed DNA polymerase n=1 Tax=Popillia japonica TaxID=7064 RepID=A0AAW1ITN3_POPJA